MNIETRNAENVFVASRSYQLSTWLESFNCSILLFHIRVLYIDVYSMNRKKGVLMELEHLIANEVNKGKA